MKNSSENWVIVGGGIHGVHLAVRLIGEAKVDPARLRIVDPGPGLLHAWHRCSANTGMSFLRSPAVHHLDLDPWSLRQFAKTRSGSKLLFKRPYDRPSVELFADHCNHVIDRFGLRELQVRDSASRIEIQCDRARVHLRDSNPLEAHRIILAMGASNRPVWPTWASALRRGGALVHHVFEAGLRLDPKAWPNRVAVIGGGITACQVALRFAATGRTVHLVSRHALRKHQFDSDPGWLGPKHMWRYSRIRDPKMRRRAIDTARLSGSAPPDVLRRLNLAIARGDIVQHQGQCTARLAEDGLCVTVGTSRVHVDGVLLATGFASRRPGGTLVDELVQSHALPCADCGYPIVDSNLRWHPRVYVTGPLAELEIGPISRNIAGARRAADRIVRLRGTA